LGVVLFRMLAGRLPFPSSSLPELFFSIQNDDPLDLPPRLPENVAAVVADLLDKDPSKRLQNSVTAIERLRQSGPVHVAETAPRPKATKHPRPIGREEEIKSVLDRIGELSSGSGAVLHLVGDAGIGKTVLMKFVADSARADNVQVFEATVDAAGLAAGAVLRSVRAGIGHLLEERLDPAARDILFGEDRAVRSGEAAWAIGCALDTLSRRGPIIVVIENIHVADEGDVAALRELTLRVRDLPVLLLMTSRSAATDESLSVSPATSPLLKLASLDGVHAMELGPLSPEDTMELLHRNMDGARLQTAVARQIVATAEGNPLFAEQLLQHLLETGAVQRKADLIEASATWDANSMPTQFGEVVERRLMGLDDGDRALLDAAAVDGREFDGAALAAAVERPLLGVLRDLQRLYRQRKLIGPSGSSFRFTSQVVHQAVYEAVTPALRQALHDLLARHYEGRDEDIGPGRLGTHWELAGDKLRARPHLLRAAADAIDSEDAKRTMEFCHRAGIHEDQVDEVFDAKDAEPWLTLECALRRLGAFEPALRLCERLVVDGGDQIVRDRAMVEKSTILLATVGPGEIDTKVLGEIQSRNSEDRVAADADYLLGLHWKFKGEFDQSLVHFDRAQNIAEALDYRDRVAGCVLDRGSVALRSSQFELAGQLYEDARERFTALGLKSSALEAEVNSILARKETGDWDGVCDRLRAVADSMRIEGHHEHAAMCCLLLASVHYGSGDVDSARAMVAEARTYMPGGKETISFVASATSKESIYALASGEVDAAMDALRRFESTAIRDGTEKSVSEYNATAAVQFAALGDVETANRIASEVPGMIESDTSGRSSRQSWPDMAEAVAFGVSGSVFSDASVLEEFFVWRDGLVAWSNPGADPAPLAALAELLVTRPPNFNFVAIDLLRRAVSIEAASRSGEPVDKMVEEALAAANQFGHVVWQIFWLRESVERCGNERDAERLDRCIVEFAQSTKDPTRQRQIFLHWAARPER